MVEAGSSANLNLQIIQLVGKAYALGYGQSADTVIGEIQVVIDFVEGVIVKLSVLLELVCLDIASNVGGGSAVAQVQHIIYGEVGLCYRGVQEGADIGVH